MPVDGRSQFCDNPYINAPVMRQTSTNEHKSRRENMYNGCFVPGPAPYSDSAPLYNSEGTVNRRRAPSSSIQDGSTMVLTKFPEETTDTVTDRMGRPVPRKCVKIRRNTVENGIVKTELRMVSYDLEKNPSQVFTGLQVLEDSASYLSGRLADVSSTIPKEEKGEKEGIEERGCGKEVHKCPKNISFNPVQTCGSHDKSVDITRDQRMSQSSDLCTMTPTKSSMTHYNRNNGKKKKQVSIVSPIHPSFPSHNSSRYQHNCCRSSSRHVNNGRDRKERSKSSLKRKPKKKIDRNYPKKNSSGYCRSCSCPGHSRSSKKSTSGRKRQNPPSTNFTTVDTSVVTESSVTYSEMSSGIKRSLSVESKTSISTTSTVSTRKPRKSTKEKSMNRSKSVPISNRHCHCTKCMNVGKKASVESKDRTPVVLARRPPSEVAVEVPYVEKQNQSNHRPATMCCAEHYPNHSPQNTNYKPPTMGCAMIGNPQWRRIPNESELIAKNRQSKEIQAPPPPSKEIQAPPPPSKEIQAPPPQSQPSATRRSAEEILTIPSKPAPPIHRKIDNDKNPADHIRQQRREKESTVARPLNRDRSMKKIVEKIREQHPTADIFVPTSQTRDDCEERRNNRGNYGENMNERVRGRDGERRVPSRIGCISLSSTHESSNCVVNSQPQYNPSQMRSSMFNPQQHNDNVPMNNNYSPYTPSVTSSVHSMYTEASTLTHNLAQFQQLVRRFEAVEDSSERRDEMIQLRDRLHATRDRIASRLFSHRQLPQHVARQLDQITALSIATNSENLID